jgi:hypothetical protein
MAESDSTCRSSTSAPLRAPSSRLPDDLISKLEDTDRFAVEQLADFEGPNIFNPLIGRTTNETLNNLEQMLALMHDLIRQDFQPSCGSGGLALLTQTAWAAAQYEAFRVQKNEVAA